MRKSIIKKAINRIRYMELLFDKLNQAENRSKNRLKNLTEYYENGKWLFDYELDEKGYIPHNMKRGILSQDAIYNFLTEINTYITNDKLLIFKKF